MNDEEKNDQKEDRGLLSSLKRSTEKAKKKGSNFIMNMIRVLKVVMPILLPALIGVFSFLAIFAFFSMLFDLEGDSAMVDSTTKTLINDDVQIAESDNGEGFYFKIDQKIMDDFLVEMNRAYENGEYDEADVKTLDEENERDDDDDNSFDDSDDNDDEDDDDDFVYDEETAEVKKEDVGEWFKTDDYEEYMIKMIRTEIASSYPKIGDYQGKDGTEDKVRK